MGDPWRQPPLDAFGPSLRAAARPTSKEAGASIFLTGQRPQSLFFVASGEAVMSRTDRRGRTLVLQRASGGFLAEASLSSSRYHCDGFARTDCELLAFPVAALRTAIDTDARVRWAWIGMLAGEIRRQRAGAERLALKSVRERLLHWLLTEGTDGRVALRTTRKELAAELGVTHEALYRTLAALARAGELVDEGDALRLK
jgi:CRP-like cAMP-binding protein